MSAEREVSTLGVVSGSVEFERGQRELAEQRAEALERERDQMRGLMEAAQADRDEWRQQHENLLAVRAADVKRLGEQLEARGRYIAILDEKAKSSDRMAGFRAMIDENKRLRTERDQSLSMSTRSEPQYLIAYGGDGGDSRVVGKSELLDAYLAIVAGDDQDQRDHSTARLMDQDRWRLLDTSDPDPRFVYDEEFEDGWLCITRIFEHPYAPADVPAPRGAVVESCPRCKATSNNAAEKMCRPETDSCPMEDRGWKFLADQRTVTGTRTAALRGSGRIASPRSAIRMPTHGPLTR